MNDLVILFHGIARSSKHLKKLCRFLEGEGYDVLNLDYPSTSFDLENLRDQMWEKITPHLSKNQPCHFVGYSMGSLLIRTILAKYRPPVLGRIVHLAPPNKGSEVADLLQHFWLYKKLYGPAGQQLITDQSSFQHLFGKVNYELGILAGSLSLDPFSSFFIKGKDDGKVSIQRTKLEGMKDHKVIWSCHTFFPQNAKVCRETAKFLKEGRFSA